MSFRHEKLPSKIPSEQLTKSDMQLTYPVINKGKEKVQCIAPI